MMKALQSLGRSLMLPVAVLPAAAILAGIGNYIINLTSGATANVIGNFILNAGTSILDNLGVLFAVGIALGLSKDKHGAAALSGLVGFLVVTNLISVDTVSGLLDVPVDEVNPAFDENENVLISSLSGITSVQLYNRFSGVQLPDAFAFFSGKRLASIMSATAMVGAAAVLLFVWPVVHGWLVSFGEFISSLKGTGEGLYGFFNLVYIRKWHPLV